MLHAQAHAARRDGTACHEDDSIAFFSQCSAILCMHQPAPAGWQMNAEIITHSLCDHTAVTPTAAPQTALQTISTKCQPQDCVLLWDSAFFCCECAVPQQKAACLTQPAVRKAAMHHKLPTQLSRGATP